MLYQSHRLAQDKDDVLVDDSAWSSEEEVGRGEVEKRDGADEREGGYERHDQRDVPLLRP